MKEQQTNNPPNDKRRSFLAKFIGGAAALGITAALPTKPSFGKTIGEDDSPADPASIFSNLKGSQRIVFDATQPHELYPFAWPKVFMMTNEMTGTMGKDCNVIVVLRHAAIGYAMGHSAWEKYPLGEVFGANDPKTQKSAKRNPFWKPAPDDFMVPGIGPVPLGINDLQKEGIVFCVCQMAMTVYSAAIAAQGGLNKDAVLADFKNALLPDIHPVPSGVWALGRAQKAGCGYIFAG